MAIDPSDYGKMSNKNLKWGYWWVTNKVKVRKIFTVILGIVAFLLVAFAAFGFLDWYFGTGVRERLGIGMLTQESIPYEELREASKPVDLQIDEPLVLASSTGEYDMYSRAINANDKWWVTFDYRIVTDGVNTKAHPSFLLPGETKNLHELGMRSDARPSSPRIEITNLIWRRVDAHEIQPDYETWANERMMFRLGSIEFEAPDPNDTLPVSKAKFTITNDTGYSYYSVGFFVTVFSGSRIAGVNYVTISDLRAGEVRPVEASWFTTLPNITRVQVMPELNLFDESVYIPPGQ